MVEAIQGQQVQGFNAIKFTTQFGEHCVATKKDGVVTIQGDKNGTREMPLNEFMEAFIKDQQKVQLEKSPKKDEVSFSGNIENAQPTKKRGKGWFNTLLVAGLGSAVGQFILNNKIDKATQRIDNIMKNPKHAANKNVGEALKKLESLNSKSGKAFLAANIVIGVLSLIEGIKLYKNRKQIKAEEKANIQA